MKEVAFRLGISPLYAKNLAHTAYQKLDVTNLVAALQASGILRRHP